MSNELPNSNDPLGFVRNMWGSMGFSLPGMVAPTFDSDEIDKRIKDLKAVEGWLRMNLSMLQMTIQGLEMQSTTLTTVKAMGSMAANAAQQAAQHVSQVQQAAQPPAQAATPAWAPPPIQPHAQSAAHPIPDVAELGADAAAAAGALSQAALWPWNLMQQVQEQLQQQADANKAKQAEKAKPAAKKASTMRRSPRKPAA